MIHLMHKAKSDSNQSSKYSWQNGLLKRKGKLVVGNDPTLRQELLKYFHSLTKKGHSGIDATMRRIAAVLY